MKFLRCLAFTCLAVALTDCATTKNKVADARPLANAKTFDRLSLVCEHGGSLSSASAAAFYVTKKENGLVFFVEDNEGDQETAASCNEDRDGITCFVEGSEVLRIEEAFRDRPMVKHGLYPSAEASYSKGKFRNSDDYDCWLVSNPKDLDRFAPGT